MKSFVNMWLICSLVVAGMFWVDAYPEMFLKGMTNPKIFETAKKNNDMAVLGKLTVISFGPLSLGAVINMIAYDNSEERYKLEQQIKKIAEVVEKK